MNEICVDASVIIKLAVAGEAHRSTARRLVHTSVASGMRLIAPPFYVSEVDTAIRRRVFEGKWTTTHAHSAFAIVDGAPVDVLTHPRMRFRARDCGAVQPANGLRLHICGAGRVAWL